MIVLHYWMAPYLILLMSNTRIIIKYIRNCGKPYPRVLYGGVATVTRSRAPMDASPDTDARSEEVGSLPGSAAVAAVDTGVYSCYHSSTSPTYRDGSPSITTRPVHYSCTEISWDQEGR